MSAALDLAVWLAVGAIGGSLAIGAAVAVGIAYRRRKRRSSTPSPPAATGAPVLPSKPATTAATPSTSSDLPRGASVIGYLTIASEPGREDDVASANPIEAACERHGWKLVEIVRDRDEGPTLARPGIHFALHRITEGHAQALVVSDLEPLSRSIHDLGALMAWFRDADATLIALNLDLDTSTPAGRHVASTLIALSGRDHHKIASGARRGPAKGGGDVRRSGPPAVSQRPELVERIAAMRAANMTLTAIADQLNAEGVPTLRGGKKWRPSSIQAALGYRRPSPRNQLPSPERQPRR
jgi:DNA invertase Pin-like site-specific DNA recombinase